MISFIHCGTPDIASYRYRARIPAQAIGAKMNESADILVFAKPEVHEVEYANAQRAEGKTIIVDFCDDHFGRLEHYDAMLELAHAVTVPTEAMAAIVQSRYDGEVVVIADPFEFEEAEPHCNGSNLLWFGRSNNWSSMERILPKLLMPMRVVSNIPLARPWSIETMYEEFARADIVLMPATKDYKSPNRTVEAIRQGCFVVAEPHPSLKDFPIWQGDIIEGVQWAIQNPQLANAMTRKAQSWVLRYSPKTLGVAWKTLCERVRLQSISAVAIASGRDGSTLIPMAAM